MNVHIQNRINYYKEGDIYKRLTTNDKEFLEDSQKLITGVNVLIQNVSDHWKSVKYLGEPIKWK